MIKILLPIIIIIIVIAGGYFGFKQISQTPKDESVATSIKTPETSPVKQELKTFQSKIMKFAIQLPQSFQIEERSTTVDIISSGGNISINRNGTNFSSLQDYINEFDRKRRIVVIDTQKLIIDGNDSSARIIKFPDEGLQQKSYYIYINNSVYILSTNLKSLYPILDQIAQSFRNTP